MSTNNTVQYCDLCGDFVPRDVRCGFSDDCPVSELDPRDGPYAELDFDSEPSRAYEPDFYETLNDEEEYPE